MAIKFFEAPSNYRPDDDFLGLSPNQMHLLLYGDFESCESIVKICEDFDPALLAAAPVVQKASLLIKLIGESGEAKATENGFLPKKIVNALIDDLWPGYRVERQSEEYAPEVLALRISLTHCGWIKNRNRRFSLTKKGRQVFEQGFCPKTYVALLRYWIVRHNWAFSDGYDECPIVQQAALFSLYVLRQKAVADFLPAEEFSQIFIRAFPAALEEIAPKTYETWDAGGELSSILKLRFLRRFARYFGLIEYINDELFALEKKGKPPQIKTTQLFGKVFRWFPKENQKLIFGAPLSSSRH